MLSSVRKGPAFKPQLRVCYLCGQQFGTASISIHIPQCYAKKVAQWEIADPATRGNRPKHPDTVNWQGEGMSTNKLNDEQFHEFTANLVPCRNCGRRFLSDRLVVHLRSCKGDSKPALTARDSGVRGGGGASSSCSGALDGGSSTRQRISHTAHSFSSSRKSNDPSSSRAPEYKSQLPVCCYLCGQQVGNNSIAFHVSQCYTKKKAQWDVANVHTRGEPPKHPDTVPWNVGGTQIEEDNEAQFAKFEDGLVPCPNCERKFLADRLVVHLHSCKLGSRSKASTQSTTASPPLRNFDRRASMASTIVDDLGGRVPNGRNEVQSATRRRTLGEDVPTGDVGKINPKVNRLQKNGRTDPTGRVCPRCSVVEYDMSAKFCRDCGADLSSKTTSGPCTHCGEQIPEGSRFCGTCGVSITDAVASEGMSGAENFGASTLHAPERPSGKTVCDADGNFSGNSGVALGDVKTSTAAPLTKEVMFCKKCGESIEDQTAKFCEECGEVLEKITVGAMGNAPHERSSTLPPEGVKSRASFMETPTLPHLASAKGAAAAEGAPSKFRGMKKEKNGNLASATRKLPNTPQGMKGSDALSLPVLSKNNLPLHHPDISEGEEAVDEGQREKCPNCGRAFAPEALARHQRVCVAQKRRRVFDMRAMRLSGTGAERVARSGGGLLTASSAPKRDWRAESEAFRRSMREARQVDKVLKSGGNARDLPPPTYSENSHYTPCPHCGRKFAPDVAERHIPRCATTVNKPKPPPRRR
ncbi:hypothetical protein TraAM80_01870 [Trypanosoma rangeli]|uniref:C2HC/C3H-type domain-containing protein n=1 Tax=Trypanosoma rangeli TaxID=5698 RepID=A0A3S5IS42_TRYRA|nr:uncharacterized protein TraAM80_01870 [Trypanosoma rangeli]RNF09845.1 hypothetical protein TraAM80_01870 [Trypanosoma rangeli]|eukprot:RNF09845.1 hypothetical protein TraAM80_01870 [Trypanosoma rangeli]